MNSGSSPDSSIKLVATIGPASSSAEVFSALLKSGLSVARLNFSHGSHSSHLKTLNTIRKCASECSSPLGIMLDTKGPEIRTGKLSNGGSPVALAEGQQLVLTTDESFCGTAEKVSISFARLPEEVREGMHIYIDDGKIELTVLSVCGPEIACRVENSSVLCEHKGVNVPGAELSLPVLTEKDKADLRFGVENGVDFVAASFIRKAQDVRDIRALMCGMARGAGSGGEGECGRCVKIISKIECTEGVDNFDEILAASDGIMIARGDLGIELSLKKVVRMQKEFIRKCSASGKPVITATQMLQSMTDSPVPTRAEVADVYNAVLDGSDGVMLSAESASGKYPVESLRFLRSVAEEAQCEEEKRTAFALVVRGGEGKGDRWGDVVKTVKGFGNGKVRIVSDDRALMRQLQVVKNLEVEYQTAGGMKEAVERMKGEGVVVIMLK